MISFFFLRLGEGSKYNTQMAQWFNPLSASVALIEKPVNWFAAHINWLVSIEGNTST